MPDDTHRAYPGAGHPAQVCFQFAHSGQSNGMRGRPLGPLERSLGWLVGAPFASWRYLARDVEIRREECETPWPVAGFPDGDGEIVGDAGSVQRAAAGYGHVFHRTYRIGIDRPLLSASELMGIVANDPNVACPLEVARFEREGTSGGSLRVGEEMKVRLPGPWNGPVRVIDITDTSFRLATLRGHIEAGEIEFRARDENAMLFFEIESWARSSNRLFDLLYDRLGIARELQLDMWAFFLERAAQISGGAVAGGIQILTERCVKHPL